MLVVVKLAMELLKIPQPSRGLLQLQRLLCRDSHFRHALAVETG